MSKLDKKLSLTFDLHNYYYHFVMPFDSASEKVNNYCVTVRAAKFYAYGGIPRDLCFTQ